MMRSPLLESLRSATADAHARVEAHFATLLSPAPTLDTYARFLSAMHAFHGAAEPLLESVDGWESLSPPLPRAPRRRLWALERDIDALGLSRTTARCALPRADDLASALGVAYVVDGSMLGARVLHRHLSTRLPTNAFAFLSAQGDETVPLFKAFVAALAHQAAKAGGEERTIAAAVGTFEALERHLTQ